MKKNILFLLTGLVLSTAFFSCDKCVKCEILGNIPDTMWLVPDTASNLKTEIVTADLVDTNNIFYDEFCGSSSEIDAFEADVQYAAESRECKIYVVRKLRTFDTLASYIYCGGPKQLADFEYGLDTLINTLYDGQDAEWLTDTILPNPATWSCK